MENFIIYGDVGEDIANQLTGKLRAGYTKIKRIEIGDELTIYVFKRGFWCSIKAIFKSKNA